MKPETDRMEITARFYDIAKGDFVDIATFTDTILVPVVGDILELGDDDDNGSPYTVVRREMQYLKPERDSAYQKFMHLTLYVSRRG